MLNPLEHSEQVALLHHGGGLRVAARQYDIPLSRWLDLSTGVNPNGWPVSQLPSSVWLRLPEEQDGLEKAARDYYAAECILPVAGSQAAIQILPQLRAASRVCVIDPGYAEHFLAWQHAGHTVTRIRSDQLDEAARQVDVMVIIHPNNPTGIRFSREQLLGWNAQLTARGGWLVLDEAFIDATPEQSLTPLCPRPGLIVLRSLGKFFGLAGARVGFVCAQSELLARLKVRLGPWSVNAPARWVATAALQDYQWQKRTRQQLCRDGDRLNALLTQFGLLPSGGCALFQWLCSEQAVAIHGALARQGVFTRYFSDPSSLRFGLPGSESEWKRLEEALAEVCTHDLVGGDA